MAGAADRGRSAVQCVLCLGHNKGMEEAASDLAVRRLLLPVKHAVQARGLRAPNICMLNLVVP